MTIIQYVPYSRHTTLKQAVRGLKSSRIGREILAQCLAVSGVQDSNRPIPRCSGKSSALPLHYPPLASSESPSMVLNRFHLSWIFVPRNAFLWPKSTNIRHTLIFSFSLLLSAHCRSPFLNARIHRRFTGASRSGVCNELYTAQCVLADGSPGGAVSCPCADALDSGKHRQKSQNLRIIRVMFP